MLSTMERVVRMTTVARHGRHAQADWAAMTPNARVALLVRMRDRMFAGCDGRLRRVARIRRLK
jgi:hypothetical protein